jgi:hypothetical protein
VIKTDQSIECIDDIHKWEKDYFREVFFEDKEKGNGRNSNSGYNRSFRKQKQQQQDPDHSDTL